jgi:hypothetical protein
MNSGATRRPRPLRLACLALPILGVLTTTIAGAAGCTVAPGTTANEIVLQLEVDEATTPVTVAAELVEHPSWLTSPDLDIELGPPQAAILRFDLAATAPLDARGTVVIRLTWRPHAGANQLAVTHRVPLSVAVEAPTEQRSYLVDECCWPTTGVQHDDAGHPVVHVLLGNTPNPWRSLTSIRFGLPPTGAGTVKLRIHDVTGRRVFTHDTPSLSAGYHQITWTGRDDSGALVPSGLYFYQLSTDRWRAVGRTMIVR